MKNRSHTMIPPSPLRLIFGWACAGLLIAAGILNLLLVHPVPGIVYLLLSLLYLPPATALLRKKTGFSIPLFVQLLLALVLILFTLGDMMD